MQRPPFLGYNKDVIYVVFSEEPELARRSAIKILKQEFPVRDELNYVAFNMAVSSLKELVDECSFLRSGKKGDFRRRLLVFAETVQGKERPETEREIKKEELGCSFGGFGGLLQKPQYEYRFVFGGLRAKH